MKHVGGVAEVPDVALLVIAKEPLPGAAKTRLCPPCSPAQAAALAQAALLDTLDAVALTPARRKVLVFEGDARRWRRDGFEVIFQRGVGLAERLAAAFQDVEGPALIVGMDTPQLTPQLLLEGLHALVQPNVDAVLGRALDGGYWSVGLQAGTAHAFDGVPMSCASTWSRQRERLLALGLRVHDQPPLRDVDTIADARAVAREAPDTRFAAALASIEPTAPVSIEPPPLASIERPTLVASLR
ncbi:MAG: TIGR04282 family arsenosugar biosynthesis glycosyltransferase [Solirubrobacteraceae bacterium]